MDNKQALYENKQPIAFLGLSNWGGIEVLDVFDELLIYRLNFSSDKPMKVRQAMIYHNMAGDAYCKIQGSRTYLSTMMKVGV